MATSHEARIGVCLISPGPAIRPLPVVLSALPDELLSSWLSRHARFYGVSGGRILRHCGLDAPSLRSLDFALSPYDQRHLAHAFRCDPWSIRKMTQPRDGIHPAGLIATTRPMQMCRRCVSRHRATSATSGALLRSWMEGWRIHCPVCGMAMQDARPLNLLTRVDPGHPLLAGVAVHARQGELMMVNAVGRGRTSNPLAALMRNLLLPRASRPKEASYVGQVPRLLDMVVPGFDRYLRYSHPDFRRPGNLLLPISIRIPVLAGVARVANRVEHWVDRLLGATPESTRRDLAACLQDLTGSSHSRGRSRNSHLLRQY